MSRALALLSVLLMLSGCGGDPPPAAPGRPSPTPTAAAAPVMPEEAKENSKAGAEAFVRHYVNVLNSSSGLGDTRALRGLQLHSCGACDAVADLIERTYRLGGRIEGDGWKILSAKTFQDPTTGEALVNTVTSVGAQRVYEATNQDPKVYAGNPRRALLWGLRYAKSHWRIISLQILPT